MNGRILHVEDDPNDVLLLQRAFKKAGGVAPTVSVVNDGEEAVAYLSGTGRFDDREAHPLPSLILLDLKIPLKSGLEVLAWIRGQPSIRRLPVIVFSSSKQMADINRAYDLGANSYLVKPVVFDELLEMVKILHAYWLSMNQNPTEDSNG